jgi:hypothetical protein
MQIPDRDDFAGISAGAWGPTLCHGVAIAIRVMAIATSFAGLKSPSSARSPVSLDCGPMEHCQVPMQNRC